MKQRITDALSRYVGLFLRALYLVLRPVYQHRWCPHWAVWRGPADSSGSAGAGCQPAPDVGVTPSSGPLLTVVTRCVHDTMPQPRR